MNKKVLFFLFIYIIYLCFTKNNYGYFWHITDLHFDLEYKEGTKTACIGVVCCRGNPVNSGKRAGRFGTLDAKCDIPIETFESALYFIKNNPIKPDFILYGGDNGDHDAITQTKEKSIKFLEVTAKIFEKYFPANEDIRVFPALGNHDVVLMDQFSLNDEKNSWFLEPFFENFKKLIFGNDEINKEIEINIKKKGYYSINTPYGLKIIVMNSLFHDIYNVHVQTTFKNDPGNQNKFLLEELEKSKINNQKTVILGHIPGGLYDQRISMYRWIKEFSVEFNENILPKYSKQILAQFYGHTHKDAFRVFWSEKNGKIQANSIGFVTPGLTTWVSQNPALRLVKYDRETLEMIDTSIYYLDLEKANKQKDFHDLVWEEEYSAKKEYFPEKNEDEPISPIDWYVLYDKMRNGNISLWNKFDKFNSVLNKITCPNSEKSFSCALRQICALGNVLKDQYKVCMNS